MVSLILASRSPRRQQLLRLIRETFLVRAADAEEVQRNGESPESFVVRMAELKAKTIGDQLKQEIGRASCRERVGVGV